MPLFFFQKNKDLKLKHFNKNILLAMTMAYRKKNHSVFGLLNLAGDFSLKATIFTQTSFLNLLNCSVFIFVLSVKHRHLEVAC